jgi:hypothetical protein
LRLLFQQILFIDRFFSPEIEYEVDVFLQVYFPNIAGERVRNLPLGRISEGSILVNQIDTETVIPIPNEFVDSGLEMALLFLSSDYTYIDAYIVKPNCILCELNAKLDLVLANLGIPAPAIAATASTVDIPTFFILGFV